MLKKRRVLENFPWSSMNMAMAILIFSSVLFCSVGAGLASDIMVLEGEGVRIGYKASLEASAEEIQNLYPGVKGELEKAIGWTLVLRPSVLMVKESTRFRMMAESPLTVAFAVPEKNLVVIDYSRSYKNPLVLRNILKHELCHLLLNYHIKQDILPRWLDEGVCQWVSDGFTDIIMDQKRSLLNRAALKNNFIPLYLLEKRFPGGNEALALAYEESRDIVTYVISRFGREGLLRVLNHMREGKHLDVALQEGLSISQAQLESEWQRSVGTGMTWFVSLSYYLYEILFAIMAIITVIAFVKMILKKRNYTDDEEDGSFTPLH